MLEFLLAEVYEYSMLSGSGMVLWGRFKKQLDVR